MPDELPLSVVTVFKDNASTIGATLEAVRGLAAEIVAVDTGSADGSDRICRDLGAVVVKRRWRGHVKTKQAALELARRAWVLHVDSDEPVLADLAGSIRELLERDARGAAASVAGARVNRVVWYRGRPLRYAWQPERRLRLVRRRLVEQGLAKWGGIDPHDELLVEPGAGEIVDLAGTLRHDSFESFAEHLERQAAYARISAEGLLARGAKPSVARLALSPVGAFVKQAVLKEGWKDGTAGWLAAATSAAGTLMKHAVLLELAEGARREDSDEAGRGPYDRAGSAEGARDGADRVEAVSPAAAGGSSRDGGGGARRSDIALSDFENGAGSGAAVTNMATEDEQSPVENETPQGGSDGGSGGGAEEAGSDGPVKKKRRRRRKRKPAGEGEGAAAAGSAPESVPESFPESADDADDEEEGWSNKPKLRAVKPVSEEARRHVFDVARGFGDLGLRAELLETLAEHGWEHPTKIQAELIPLALTGKDVLGQAKTGSGKTAAFGLPILERVTPGDPLQALILAPTRELAIQIKDDLEELAKRIKVRVCPIYGGQKIQTQARKLERGPEIIVGTPGRILDMHGRRLLPLDGVRIAVLDEVDRMFDIGFRDDIRRILSLCPKERQTVFVSATISEEIERLASRHMRDPQRLTVSSGSLTVEMVKQHHIPVRAWDKKRMLAHVLTHEAPDLTIVFCRMKRTVDDVAGYLSRKGIESMALHGDLSQGQRNKTMTRFRHGSLAVLVASDLAARGLDVDGISHVVNYDLPDDPDLYVHRIGRTARAGREGIAWSLVTPEQGGQLTEIEHLINAEIPKKEYPDFEGREAPPEGWKPEPKGGFQPVVVEGADQPARSRFETASKLPADRELSPEELAKKFPGGVVPKKPPKKAMRGRVRTARSNKLD